MKARLPCPEHSHRLPPLRGKSGKVTVGNLRIIFFHAPAPFVQFEHQNTPLESMKRFCTDIFNISCLSLQTVTF